MVSILPVSFLFIYLIQLFKKVNGDNNNGVLLAETISGENKDGRLPTMWSGSVNILKQYVENALASKGNNPEPVKYGHCFVYAGLVTTSKGDNLIRYSISSEQHRSFMNSQSYLLSQREVDHDI